MIICEHLRQGCKLQKNRLSGQTQTQHDTYIKQHKQLCNTGLHLNTAHRTTQTLKHKAVCLTFYFSLVLIYKFQNDTLRLCELTCAFQRHQFSKLQSFQCYRGYILINKTMHYQFEKKNTTGTLNMFFMKMDY